MGSQPRNIQTGLQRERVLQGCRVYSHHYYVSLNSRRRGLCAQRATETGTLRDIPWQTLQHLPSLNTCSLTEQLSSGQVSVTFTIRPFCNKSAAYKVEGKVKWFSFSCVLLTLTNQHQRLLPGPSASPSLFPEFCLVLSSRSTPILHQASAVKALSCVTTGSSFSFYLSNRILQQQVDRCEPRTSRQISTGIDAMKWNQSVWS